MAPNQQTEDSKEVIEGLPLMVVSPVDVGRLIRELTEIDNWYLQYRLKSPDLPPVKAKTSIALEQTLAIHRLSIMDEKDRQHLQKFLKKVKEHSPLLHMSFSADPSTTFVEKLMSWLRREIHPALLLTIGLQPNIGAGCIIRSTNKYFDCSLRSDFLKKRQILADLLSAQEPSS